MSMQAFIGQASFGCYVGKHVWVECSQRNCKVVVRTTREQAKGGITYCCQQCMFKS